MAKRKKKKRIKIKNVILLLLLTSFIGLMIYYFIMMPIENIYINGNKIVSDDEIMEISNIDTYPSFILTNRFAIKEQLLKNDYIKDVVIKKKLGNVLEFKITEYKIVAINKDNNILLSNGKLLPNNYNIYDIPLLLNEITDEEVYKLFSTKMENLDEDILRQISEIEYSPVEVDNKRFIFYMNDKNIVHISLPKITKLNKYNKIKDKLENKKGIIYLDSGDYVELLK